MYRKHEIFLTQRVFLISCEKLNLHGVTSKYSQLLLLTEELFVGNGLVKVIVQLKEAFHLQDKWQENRLARINS